VLRTVRDRPTLWEALLPPEALVMPAELEAVDRLLDDPRLFEPFRRWFDPELGRPPIPIETYLRLMFLKYRFRLGYETLCVEVADSLTWRRFCRIPIGESVPHPSTLMKITTRCGPGLIDELNAGLLAAAVEAGVVDIDWLRADTTVVPADIKYPTDSGLLVRGITKAARPPWPARRRTGSARSCDAATTTPKPTCWPSPANWPISRRSRLSRPGAS
jgi:transposase, IS5 family